MNFPESQVLQLRKLKAIDKKRRKNTVKKGYIYKNIVYMIEVILDYKVEKCINGKRWDKIIVDCRDVYTDIQTELVHRDALLEIILLLERTVNSKIDKLDNVKTGIEKELEEMGFKNG